MSFTWTKFFNELFLRVVKDYDPKTLAELAYKIFPEKALMDRDEKGNEFRLKEFEPCTFLARFNRVEDFDKKIEYCQKAVEILDLKSPVPEDFDGIPRFNNMGYWFFPFKHNRKGNEFELLWQFARDLAEGQIKEQSFNNAMQCAGTGFTYLTIICFIVWPDKFPSIDYRSMQYLGKTDDRYNSWLKKIKKNDEPFNEYVELTQRISMDIEHIQIKNFLELSHSAYLDSSTNKKHEKSISSLPNNDVQYWVGGAMWGSKNKIDKTQEFINNGVWENGFNPGETDTAAETIKLAKKGDYIAIKSSSTKGPGHSITFTKVKAIGVIKENIGDGATLKVNWLYKGPEFDIEGVSYRKTFQRVDELDHIQQLFCRILSQEKLASKINENTSMYTTNEFNSNNPCNRIYWGPPGTGKTFKLLQLQKEFEDDTGQDTLDNIMKWVQDSKWWEVIAASMIEINHHVTVPELFQHDLMQIKYRQSTSKSPKHAIWAQLQLHTVNDSVTVNTEARQEPFIFDKDKESKWFLSGSWKEQLADLISEISDIRRIKNTKVNKRYEMITFHQSYSYEEFVEGIRPIPTEDGKSLIYDVKPGIFRKLCLRAIENPTQEYAIFIDEINRGNISKIFGELITLIEKDKRLDKVNETTVTLPYSEKIFGVPSNLHIIGTMNSVDRSIALVDMALRRRFEFIAVRPDSIYINNQIDGINIKSIFENLNNKISVILGSEYQIGHSYFMDDKTNDINALKQTWFGSVLPLLQEYLFDDWEKLRALVGDFVIETNVPSLDNLNIPRTTFGSFVPSSISDEDFIRYLVALE